MVDADSGESYGKITDVSQTGANDVYPSLTKRETLSLSLRYLKLWLKPISRGWRDEDNSAGGAF